ncbi:AzlC family ABC transporter permease [Aureimonas leprariae]|uniref:AzlC family ABC transporter permease n=1 Tax=Plantimonas leprariae TaxID=2615207 RepID=A0A7V7PLI5_9HYPH|nr:AzlC family ABC transporter permease [Aureimonas leprariae]KAB0677338.1 AzlC family ABC transporter permease [Aureimonas leprariae]
MSSSQSSARIASSPAVPSFLSEYRRGARAISPAMAAVVAYGLVFGAQASQKGLSLLEVALMTGLNYAGGSEFAAVGLWASPPPLFLIAAVTFLINSRHLIMGAALTPYLKHLPRWRALTALFFMSDETWAVGYADAARRAESGEAVPFSSGFYAACGSLIYVGWLAATATGAAVGPLLGDVEAIGFDMAFPAVFLSIVAGMWKGPRAARPWAISLVVGALTHLAVPGAWYVVAASLAGLATAFYSGDAE